MKGISVSGRPDQILITTTIVIVIITTATTGIDNKASTVL
jgi:hypothetical protein